MRIGIDADGVLTDLTAFNLEYGERFFGRKADNLYGYDVKDMARNGRHEKTVLKSLPFLTEMDTDCLK